MMVATREPPGLTAAAVASQVPAMAAARSSPPLHSTTARETLPASAGMSMSSSGSASLCHVAMSPTSTTMGLPARLALWALLSAFASPGPRWSSASAGLRAMRA